MTQPTEPTNRMEKTALVVGDDHFTMKLICSYLEKDGFSCLTASTGEEALEKLAEQEAAFVLTGVPLVGMSGIALQKQVSRQYPDVFVLFLAGAADMPDVVRALRNGVCDFVVKPFSQEEVSERMVQAMEKRRELLSSRDELAFQERRLEAMSRRYNELANNVRRFPPWDPDDEPPKG